MTLASSPTHRSLDDALGPASSRYFGNGYRAVIRRLSPLEPTGPDSLSAVAALGYPPNWSVKTAGSLVPHLSSVDAVILVTTAATAAVTSALGVDDGEITEENVVSITVSAGSQPIEDLSTVPVTLRFRGDGTSPTTDEATTLDYTVGTMRGQITVAHPAGRKRTTVRRALTLDADQYPSLDRVVQIDDLTVDSHAVTGDAAVIPLDAAAAGPVTLVDGLVGAAQLAQIALYHLDRIDRRSSHTLWMRKLTLRAASRPSVGTRFPARLAVTRSTVLSMGGHPWRSANLDLTGFGGITANCLAAHRIPS